MLTWKRSPNFCLMYIFRHSISFELYKTVSCDMNSESRNFQWFLASGRIFHIGVIAPFFLSRKNGGLQQFHGCCQCIVVYRHGKLGNTTQICGRFVHQRRDLFVWFFSQAALGTLKLQLFQKLFPELAELLTKVYLLTSNKESRRVQVESRKRPISIYKSSPSMNSRL